MRFNFAFPLGGSHFKINIFNSSPLNPQNTLVLMGIEYDTFIEIQLSQLYDCNNQFTLVANCFSKIKVMQIQIKKAFG